MENLENYIEKNFKEMDSQGYQETLNQSKLWLEMLASGFNPLNGEKLDKDSILNDVQIARCLFFASREINKSKPRLKAFEFNPEVRENIHLSEKPVSLSAFCSNVTEVNGRQDMKPLSYKEMSNWLVDGGILMVGADNKKYPTEQGLDLGLSVEDKVTNYGRPYTVVLYNKAAQQFLLDNIEQALA